MRPLTLLCALIGALYGFLTPGLATAQPAPLAQTQANPQRQADLSHIESYLNGISTAEADFTFAAPDGQISHGMFYLNRPDKLRFEYTDPAGNLLIADGSYVIYWDAGQKEASNLPIKSTPLAFLLRPQISLTDGVEVTGYEHNAGIIRVRLVQTHDSSAGSVTIAFTDQPLELRGWRLVDPGGQITDVTFSNWRFGMTLDPGLFHFESPNAGKRHR